jgi:hypothetical protein
VPVSRPRDHARAAGVVVTVYLLHAARPYVPEGCEARPWCWLSHYAGWCDDIDERMRKHQAGQGANVCRVWKEAGIPFALARTWPGGRIDERRLKNSRHLPRFCPECYPKPRIDRWAGGREAHPLIVRVKAREYDPVMVTDPWAIAAAG